MRIGVTVVGAGSWGTTVGHLCAHNGETVIWARDPDVAADITARHRNDRYLEGHELHPELTATADLAAAVGRADLLVMAVPSHGFRATLEACVPHVRAWVPVVSLTKGLEQGTRRRMTEIVHELLPGHPSGVLTGPNLAREILAGHAAASVVAMSDPTVATELQGVFANRFFRVYRNEDVVGCEIAGALKNVMAIAAGMAVGLGTGDNTRAAVITRGLAELSRLGVALGGRAVTFSGLAGMGDLVATCISPQSRNRHVGEQLGRGRSLEEIQSEMHMVAEGVRTVRVVRELAADLGVDTPIADQVYRVCYESLPASRAYRGLLPRSRRWDNDEFDGFEEGGP